MKVFDETMVDCQFIGEGTLGQRLRVDYSVNDKFSTEINKISRRDFEKKLEALTEWVIIDPKDKEYSRIIKGNELYLDESLFEKQIMVHVMFRAEGFFYRGMPFQKQYKFVDLDFRRLGDCIDTLYGGRLVPNENEVDRIYKYFAQNLVEYSGDLNKRYKLLIKPENSEFLYDLYKKDKTIETDTLRLKTLEEEKNHWLEVSEELKRTTAAIQASNGQMTEELTVLREQNTVLLEEKNYFINSKYFKNTNDFSFLDDKSHELNQTNFIVSMSKELINPIAIAGNNQNNTFDFGLIDDELQNVEVKKEYQQLKDKVAEYDRMLKNYRTEIEKYAEIYSQNKIDFIINDNKHLKVQVVALQNQLEEYKKKLHQYDFTVKYLSKENEDLKASSKLFGSGGQEESLMLMSTLSQKLSAEVVDRDKKIAQLEETVKRLLNDIHHNQTF